MAPPLQKSSSASQAADQLQIHHFTHEHMLNKVYMASDFKCNGCNTGGHGLRYHCAACDFDLHEKCAMAPHRTSSHLHPQHQLILTNRPGDSHLCNVCRGFTNGLSYTCECPTCQFDVHVLCVEIPVAKGVPSTLDRSQSAGGMSWGQPATVVGGLTGVNINSQPVMISPQQQLQLQHQQQQMQMQKQGMPMTAFNGYNEMNNTQPMMVNHHQQQPSMPTTGFVGYNGANTNQQMMINQQMMLNQQPQQPQFYNNKNTNQPLMVNQPQQQFCGYPGVNNNQMMMMQPQQQPGMPMTMYGGYNPNMMMNQQKKQQPQQPGTSSNYANIGKFAANIVTTSLIGIPLFNSRR